MIIQETRTVWVTSDGREFRSRAAAEAHEAREQLTRLLEAHGVRGSVINGVTLAEALLEWRTQNR